MIPISEGIVEPLQPFDFGKSCSIYARFGEWTHTAFLGGILYKSFEEDGVPSFSRSPSGWDRSKRGFSGLRRRQQSGQLRLWA